jgi:membrane protein implicated in regulation of membrane protease activity
MQEISPLPPEPKGPLRTILIILAVGSFVLMLGVIIAHVVTSFTLGDIGVVLFILFFIVGAVYLVIRRGLEMRRLATEGVETTGTVVEKYRRRRGDRRIRYEYCNASGQKHQGRAGVSWKYYEAVKVGDPVKVVYLPQRPSVSALLAEVELVRRAHQHRSS